MTYRIYGRRDGVWEEIARTENGDIGVAAVNGIAASCHFSELELRHEDTGPTVLYRWPQPEGTRKPRPGHLPAD